MRTIHREIVSAMIISNDDKILLGKKNPQKGGVYADCWHLPGGGVDERESLEEALKREILEETGINITDLKCTLADTAGKGESEKMLKDTGEKVLCRMHFNVYKVEINKVAKDIEIIVSDDLEVLRWFDMSEMGTLKLTPPSVSLFERLSMIS